MALELTINAVDRTSVLEKDTLTVEQQAANFISICTFVLLDTEGDIPISTEQDISLVDGATTFFSGRIVDVRYTLIGMASRRIHIKCQDPNYQLAETIVDTEEVYAAEADADIIDDLFDTYLPVIDSETYVDTLQDPLTITFEQCTLRSALSQLCTRTGGYFYIDFDNCLHYFDEELDTVAWWLSDTPDNVNSFAYLNTDIDRRDTATTRLDGVYVVGEGVDGWRGTHAPGDRQGIARDGRITTNAGVNQRGDAVLDKYGDAQITYTVKTYQPGLRAGMDVRFVCVLYDVDDTFTVRRMTIRWDGSGTAYYILTLGAVVNPALQQDRNWMDGLRDVMGPAPTPVLPTSSQGWSHDIVFSATDNDTVAWAGGGTITLADGTTYAINAGNTGNMGNITYIYLDLDTSEVALQTTILNSTAVGTRKILVAVAEDVADATKDAIYQVFGGAGQGMLVIQENIAALSITSNEIAVNTIVAGNIATGAVDTDEIAANAVTATKIHMGIGTSLFNSAGGLLLLNPYCEINTTQWWSLRRQLATISGCFHQVAGRWLGTRALVVEEATANRLLNPSLETNTTGWTGVGATLSQETSMSVIGDASAKLVVTGPNPNQGIVAVVTAETAPNTEYTFSVWLRGSGTVRLGMYDTPTTQWGSVITLTDTWTRYEFTATFAAGVVRQIAVYTDIHQANTFYCDGFQLEAKDYTTTYCDGSLGSGYAWDGTAHASTSTRTATEVNLDNLVGDLLGDRVSWTLRVIAQMPYDADATIWPAADCFLFDTRAAADNNNRVALLYTFADDKFYVYINGANRLETGVQSFSAGDWIEFVLTFDFTNDDYNLYIDGMLIDNDTTVLAPPTGLTLLNIGSDVAAANQAGFAFAEFAVLDGVLSLVELSGIHALQQPLVDLGAVDTPGIYILDGNFRIASGTTGNRVEITPEEIAGYDSAGTKQFYLQSVDGVAYAGAGAVVLDADGLRVTGTGGVADNTRRIIFNYDQAGTEYLMSRYFGDWGGAGRAVTWVQSWCQAGDPWAANGSSVVLAALDTVAGDDTRISIESSGLISVGGTQFQLAATTKLHLDGAEIEFDAASGGNLIEIVDNYADALHVSSNQPMEFLRFITTNGGEIIAFNPGMLFINVGFGTIAPVAHTATRLNITLQDTTNDVTIRLLGSGSSDTEWVCTSTASGIGTRSNDNFTLFTNNVTRVTITAGGYVGIAISPNNPLDVYANVSSVYVAHIFNDQGSAGHGLHVQTDGTGSGTIAFLVQTGTYNPAFQVRGADAKAYCNFGAGPGSAGPSCALDVDSNSNTSCLRLRGTDATNQIADFYVTAAGTLVVTLTPGTETAKFFDFRSEDNAYGFLLRESDGTGTGVYANFYVADATPDYINITVGASNTTAGFVITSSETVGVRTKTPDGTFHIQTGSAGAVTASASGNDLVVEAVLSSGMSMLSPNNGAGTFMWGFPASNAYHYIQAFGSTHGSAGYMVCVVAGATAYWVHPSGHFYPGTNKVQNLGLPTNRWLCVYSSSALSTGTSRLRKAGMDCPVCNAPMFQGTGGLLVTGEVSDFTLVFCRECGTAAMKELCHRTRPISREPPEITFEGFKVMANSGNSRTVQASFRYGKNTKNDLGTVIRAPHNSTFLNDKELAEFEAMTPNERTMFLYDLGLREWEALEEMEAIGPDLEDARSHLGVLAGHLVDRDLMKETQQLRKETQ